MLQNYSNKPERNKRVAGEIQKLFSSIMLFEVKDPRLLALRISQINLTKDLKLAKVFFTVEDPAYTVEECLVGLQSCKSFLKKAIAQRLNFKYTPELKFYFDETLKLQDTLRNLFADDENEDEDNI